MKLSCSEKFVGILRGITSNHHKDRTEKFKKYEMQVCNDHDYCYTEMSDEGNKILKYNYGKKSLKAPFMIYAGFECLLEKNQLMSK